MSEDRNGPLQGLADRLPKLIELVGVIRADKTRALSAILKAVDAAREELGAPECTAAEIRDIEEMFVSALSTVEDLVAEYPDFLRTYDRNSFLEAANKKISEELDKLKQKYTASSMTPSAARGVQELKDQLQHNEGLMDKAREKIEEQRQRIAWIAAERDDLKSALANTQAAFETRRQTVSELSTERNELWRRLEKTEAALRDATKDRDGWKVTADRRQKDVDHWHSEASKSHLEAQELRKCYDRAVEEAEHIKVSAQGNRDDLNAQLNALQQLRRRELAEADVMRRALTQYAITLAFPRLPVPDRAVNEEGS